MPGTSKKPSSLPFAAIHEAVSVSSPSFWFSPAADGGLAQTLILHTPCAFTPVRKLLPLHGAAEHAWERGRRVEAGRTQKGNSSSLGGGRGDFRRYLLLRTLRAEGGWGFDLYCAGLTTTAQVLAAARRRGSPHELA